MARRATRRLGSLSNRIYVCVCMYDERHKGATLAGLVGGRQAVNCDITNIRAFGGGGLLISMYDHPFFPYTPYNHPTTRNLDLFCTLHTPCPPPLSISRSPSRSLRQRRKSKKVFPTTRVSLFPSPSLAGKCYQELIQRTITIFEPSIVSPSTLLPAKLWVKCSKS